MLICTVQLHNAYKGTNALTFRMSGEHIRLQFLPKLCGGNSWIVQMTRQQIPDCWSLTHSAHTKTHILHVTLFSQ